MILFSETIDNRLASLLLLPFLMWVEVLTIGTVGVFFGATLHLFVKIHTIFFRPLPYNSYREAKIFAAILTLVIILFGENIVTAIATAIPIWIGVIGLQWAVALWKAAQI